MATIVKSLGLKNMEAIDLLLALRGDVSRELRPDYLKFMKETPEYKKEIVKELEELLDERARASLRREFGELVEVPINKMRGELRKEFPRRKREIVDEMMLDLRARGATARRERRGDFGPFSEQSRALAAEDVDPLGVAPGTRRIDTSERLDRSAKAIENLIAGETGAVGSQLERGGTSIVQSPTGTTTTLTRDVAGQIRSEVYDIDPKGNIVTGIPADPKTRRVVSDMSRRRFDKETNERRKSKGPALSNDPAEIERNRFLKMKREEAGGMSKMLSSQEIRRLPDNIREKIPARTGAEVYRMPGGTIRVIAPGVTDVPSLEQTRKVFMYSKLSDKERESLAGDSAKRRYRKRQAPGFEDLYEEEIVERLKNEKYEDITDQPGMKQKVARAAKAGVMPPINASSYRIFQRPGSPAGEFIVVADAQIPLAVPGRAETEKKRSLRTKLTTTRTFPEVEGKITPEPQVSTTGYGGLTAAEEAQTKAARRGRVMSGDLLGGREETLFQRGLTPGEANMEIRRMMAQDILAEGAEEFKDMIPAERDPIVIERVNQRLSEISPTEYLRDKLREAKKPGSSLQATRLEELAQTIQNLTPAPGDVDMANIQTQRLLTPMDELAIQQDDLLDLVERRAGVPSSRSRAVSGFATRTPGPLRTGLPLGGIGPARAPGPLGVALRIADLVRRAT